MDEIASFGEIVLIVSAGLLAAILLRAFAERIAVPAAALFLVAAAVASDVFRSLGDTLSFVEVERIAVVALIVILFDGGMHVGWRRFRAAAVPVALLGTVGTFATAGLIAVAAH
jgi:potassium/hydrogen antiporter